MSMERTIEDALRHANLVESLDEPLSSDAMQRLIAFLKLRAKWARTHNLSGPRALAQVSTDVADAVAVWLCHDPSSALLDVGSGSGAPGLMVACLDPERVIHLVEPIAKRCAFIRTAAHQLNLKRVSVHRGRWPSEALDQLGAVTPISRAVVSPEVWPELAQRDHLSSLMQMLAHQRPEWPLRGYELTREVSYQDPEGGPRVVRRWERTESE